MEIKDNIITSHDFLDGDQGIHPTPNDRSCIFSSKGVNDSTPMITKLRALKYKG